jgi:uncharacterized protein (DUF924 family)
MMSDPVDVLDFWIGEVGPQGWYAGSAELDASIKDRFFDLWQAADADGLEHWVDGVVGTLAYLIVCDQFSRNLHRGSKLAFATDARAQAAARLAIANGWDFEVPEPERQFFYMPFEHSENAQDQALGVTYLSERVPSLPDMALHARSHQWVIDKFGRFPFRNVALGRDSTPEELEFLDKGGYAALVNTLRAGYAQGA